MIQLEYCIAVMVIILQSLKNGSGVGGLLELVSVPGSFAPAQLFLRQTFTYVPDINTSNSGAILIDISI